ncbi:MAG: glycosyltransferase family 39 protein [Chloroflexota bacterium]
MVGAQCIAPAFIASTAARVSLLATILPLLLALKVALWAVAPTYGLAATYYPRARIGGTPEQSTEFRSAPYTRIERSPGQPGFALHFFNDVERFNYYEPPDPSRYSLPFAVRYEGYTYLDPATGPSTLELTAQGVAVLALDGVPFLTVGRRDAEQTERAPFQPASPSTPVQLDYLYQGSGTPSLRADAGVLTVEPVSADALARDRVLGWLATVLDLLVLAGLVGAGGVAVWRRLRLVLGLPARRWQLLERPLLASLLLVVLAYALVTSRGLAGRAVILEGGQDWLTYESYSRDILLNGPLMTLGEPLGKGKPYFFQPFYPYYLAAMHWLTGEGLWGPVALQLLGVGVAGVLVYYLGKRLFGMRAGLLALTLYLVLGLSQLDWIARKLLSENLYFILLPAAMLLLVRAIDERRLVDVVWAGLLFGIAAITRAPTLLVVPGAALILALAWRRASDPWRRALTAFVLLGLCTASVAALVPLRNYVVSGRPALVATNGGSTLLLAHQPTDRVRLSGIDRDPLYNALKLDRPTREVVEFARQDPAGYLWTLVPLGLYAVGISNGIEGSGLVAPDVLTITALYVLAVILVPATRALRTWPLHLFVLIHLAIMMTFLPYVYGYRQVLPMQLLMLPFDGALLARLFVSLAGRRGERQRHDGTGQPLLEQRTTG